MAMVVRTNYSALNATKHLNKNQSGVAGSIEKLSSGFKVNRAADDAAGLAISEKMKAQIKALDVAVANAEDGIGLIQTTEGYLDSVHAMLNRMVELSEKSANGIMQPGTLKASATATASQTWNAPDVGNVKGGFQDVKGNGNETGGVKLNTANTDRDALQQEMNQLCAEIDRVAATANFNKVKLFNGNLATEQYTKISYSVTAGQNSKNILASLSAAQNAASLGLAPSTITVTNEYGAATNVTLFTVGTSYIISGTSLGQGLKLQIGETSNAADKLTVSVGRFHTDTLFSTITDYKNDDGDKKVALDLNPVSTTKGVVGYTIDISGQDRASAAAEALNTVINKVSDQRAALGAQQNRLDYTVNNLNTASENMQASNSRIRDTDMAKEMTKFTMTNVLLQSAQAMLAQANSQPQNVLQLLR